LVARYGIELTATGWVVVNRGGRKVAVNSLVAIAQARLDELRRKLRVAVIDFDVSDEDVLELRQESRLAYDELKEINRKAEKKGILGFLGF
jgi:hypothetical protein